MSRSLCLLSILQLLTAGTLAQFPPTPEGVTTVNSQECDGASLSYKQTYICETTPGVKGFSGFVNLPASLTGESYDIHTFYWYFESRKDPKNAPLSIYLAGGAGESSMDGATSEGGPCIIGADSNSTTLNPWSLNNEVNMLYIDQPVQTGFSYDSLVNGTLDLLQYVITPTDFDGSEGNATSLWGTFSSQNQSRITAGSGRGANALWHFMQVWVTKYWAGFYIPTTFAMFIKRNEQIIHGNPSERPKSERVLPLDVMGLANGCIDALIESPHYPEQATNNTYGYHAYNQSVFEAAEDAFSMPGQCRDNITHCRTIAAEGDPEYNGNNETVNDVCGQAFGSCYASVQGGFKLSGRSAFDMAHQFLDPFPYYRQSGYFNQAWVQSALGTPLNFTDISYLGSALYENIGDALRVGVENVNLVLDKGYRVAMAYGDRDYRCNWLGAEATSLAAEWPHAKEFRESGYADITTNGSYTGGYVRQTGKFSFSRVFQSGHAVLAYQPETISRIFTRTMFGLDVATGTKKYHASGKEIYRTEGPLTVREVTQVFPEMPPTECYIWNAEGTCTDDQFGAFENGTAVVEDYYVVNPSP